MRRISTYHRLFLPPAGIPERRSLLVHRPSVPSRVMSNIALTCLLRTAKIGPRAETRAIGRPAGAHQTKKEVVRLILTPEQQALLDGKEGEIMAKIVKTLVMYGDAFGAERMVPVTSKYGHTVISFGLKIMEPIYNLYDQLIEAGLPAGQKFTADPT